MDAQLLQTKLYIPPPRPELVPRPRLIERLNAGLGLKLTLVSAPAGFGKTTLVSEWVTALRSGGQRSARIAWLSLDESDNDPTRFLTYLIAALQTIQVDIGKGALSALQSPQPPPVEGILTALINEIAALPDHVILVLDDYHLIDVVGPREREMGSAAIHDALAFLLRRMPPQLHLVITTREDPPLPLARLRARGQLTELRARDLRFTSSEAAEFLNQVVGPDLSADDVAALETRTEGWIAGLQLAALALQGTPMKGSRDAKRFVQSFTGSHRYVLDYLIEEVLEQQPEQVRAFMLQTAILDRLCGPLCDAVLLDSSISSQETLEYLQRANLFVVPLDEERRWCRYHHLFVDLLRRRLHQVQPEQAPTLHCRASVWYEQNGFVDEAIEHALRAEDFERAIVLIEGVVEVVWMQARHVKLQRWLDRAPLEWVFSRPQLCIFYGWNLFATGKQDAAETSLRAAEQALAFNTDGPTETLPIERGPQSDMDRMTLQGRIAVTRACMAFFRGDVPEIIRLARQAIEYLPGQDLWRSTAMITLGDAHLVKGEITQAYRAQLGALAAGKAVGNIYMILMANLKLAITLRQLGRLDQVIEICRQQLQFADENGLAQTAAGGWSLAIWAEVLAELGDLDRAIHQAKKGVELTRHGGDVGILGSSYLYLTRVLFTGGDLTAAEEAIQEMEHIARETFVPPWIMNLIATWQARIWLAQDNLNAATQWMLERGLGAGQVPTVLYEMDYSIVSARILLAQGRLDEATSLLQGSLQVAQAGGRTTSEIEILALQALALQAENDTEQAITTLERALALAEPGGFVRTFVDEGPPMARLLYQALDRGITPDYTRRLLAAFPLTRAEPFARNESTARSEQAAEPGTKTPSTAQAPGLDLIEPLSGREVEVLELIAQGLTNQEIASRLVLSLHTIKAHTRNIYGKLGVHNRTEAVARGRALGVLSST